MLALAARASAACDDAVAGVDEVPPHASFALPLVIAAAIGEGEAAGAAAPADAAATAAAAAALAVATACVGEKECVATTGRPGV